MCRNIKILYNFDPPATNTEIEEAATQFVRKISGFNKPSRSNESVFDAAIKDVSEATKILLNSLVTVAPARNRQKEAERAKARGATRFQ